jgi:hypothetical protein
VNGIPADTTPSLLYVDDIAEIAENETEENAILIAQDRN